MKHTNTRTMLAGATALVLPRAVQRVMAEAPSNPAAVLTELQQAWTAFQASHDQAMASRDTVDTERTARIDASIEAMQSALDQQASQVAAFRLNGSGGEREQTPEQRAYAQAFSRFFRNGDQGAEASLSDLAVQAAMQTQSDPDGGYLVTPEMERAIDRRLGVVSAMRGIARVISIGSGEYRKRVSVGGTRSGWVGETDPRPVTEGPKINLMSFPVGEIYAQPEATQTLLDDAEVDLETWLAGEVEIEFAEQEGAAFINGNGVKKPRGLLDYEKVADANHAWGKLGFVVSGDATKLTADGMIDLTYAPKTGYLPGARYLMNRKSVGAARKLKNEDGDYLWQPSLQAGQPSTFSGIGITVDDNMPDIGAGAYPVAFGDFGRGYLIVDRTGIRVLRDPFTAKPFVLFYTTKRVGGGVQDFDAIKLMKVAAS